MGYAVKASRSDTHLLLHGINDFLEMLCQDVALGRQGTHTAVLLGEIGVDAISRSRSALAATVSARLVSRLT